MNMIKSPAEIALMREAGRVVANALAAVREGTIPIREALQDIDRKVTTLVAKK